MTLLSTFSILAYNCVFHETFTLSPVGFMFHLFYYRSHHCDGSVDWSLLQIENLTSLVEPKMPHEIEPVTRTFYVAVIQLIFNAALFMASAFMLGEFYKKGLAKPKLKYSCSFDEVSLAV